MNTTDVEFFPFSTHYARIENKKPENETIAWILLFLPFLRLACRNENNFVKLRIMATLIFGEVARFINLIKKSELIANMKTLISTQTER